MAPPLGKAWPAMSESPSQSRAEKAVLEAER